MDRVRVELFGWSDRGASWPSISIDGPGLCRHVNGPLFGPNAMLGCGPGSVRSVKFFLSCQIFCFLYFSVQFYDYYTYVFCTVLYQIMID